MLEWWLLASARILALVFTAPWLGHRSIPWMARLGMGLAFCVSVMPVAPQSLISLPAVVVTGQGGAAVTSAALPTVESTLVLAILREVAIGIALGVALAAFVFAAEFVGQIASQIAGLQWGELSETGDEATPLGRLLQWLAILLFLGIQGPERLLAAVMDSCQAIPVGQIQLLDWPAAQWLLAILKQSLWLALRGVGPLVAVILSTHLLMGILSRVAPQLGLFQAGLSVNLAAFWLTMVLIVTGSGWLFHTEISNFLTHAERSLLSSPLAVDSTPVPTSRTSQPLERPDSEEDTAENRASDAPQKAQETHTAEFINPQHASANRTTPWLAELEQIAGPVPSAEEPLLNPFPREPR